MAKSRTTPSAPLFESAPVAGTTQRPLADRLRPWTLGAVIGPDHLLGEDGPFPRIAGGESPRSMIFWGPPGTGKTSVARLMASGAGLHFEQLSAIFSGVQDLRKVFEAARDRRRFGQGTILFVDEIHRFNRSQQGSFPPYVEDGTIILIGATTENPSFELNGALLSRTKVLVFKRLTDDDLEKLLERAEGAVGKALPLSPDAREGLVRMADGDGRTVLNLAEDVFSSGNDREGPIDAQKLVSLVQRRAPLYDKNRDGHYDLISALHKSVRGSDPDASLYWFCRMIDGGEDPL